MAGYRGLLTGTHLVLSRWTNRDSAAAPEFSPDIFFTLFIPPTDVEVSWRSPHVVRALFASVHVDSGNFRLGDLSISLMQGVKRALSSSRQGNPVILTGKERASELRAFLRRASRAIRDKTHRLEFHMDSRNLHYEIVPEGGQTHRISNSNSSRVGGALTDLQFVIVDDLERSANPVATVEDQIGTVGRAISHVLGEATYAVALTEQGLTLAEKGINTLTNFIADSRIVLQRVGDVVNGVERIQAAPLNMLRALNNTVDTLRRDVINPNTNRSTSERLKRVGEEYDRLIRILYESARDTRRGSFASSSAIANQDQSQLTTVQRALTDAGDPLSGIIADSLDRTLGGAFEGLSGRMSKYTGWLPYTVKKGDTLQDVAGHILGDPNKWMDIAVINGFSSNLDLVPGVLIQIPVTNGGFDFSVQGFEGIKAVKAALEESAFYRDIKVERIGESNRWVIDRQSLTDLETISGPENYIQRFDKVVFNTELGSNPEFRNVGIYLGLGEPRVKEVVGLTHLTSRQQLAGDPRTLSVRTIGRAIDNLSDRVDIAYEVETVSTKVQLAVEVLGGLL